MFEGSNVCFAGAAFYSTTGSFSPSSCCEVFPAMGRLPWEDALEFFCSRACVTNAGGNVLEAPMDVWDSPNPPSVGRELAGRRLAAARELPLSKSSSSSYI